MGSLAKSMMVVGTASHAGKSWMTTAICRYLRRRGLRVAPFKAQNMSLNSYPCADGGEIGRAQVAQAQACGLAPTTDMNPILLKPTSSAGCQVIVNGRVWRQLSAADYYEHYEFLLEQVLASFRRLAREYEFIVLEGAGSAAEINLRSRDLVNLPLAVRLDAPAMLVADIDRGGVFASVVGTFALLEPAEAALVRSFAVNRFRGDLKLFHGGGRMMEERTERPCLGVFPFLEGVHLDAEDSVGLDDPRPREHSSLGLEIVIIRLPHISNFTDFRNLPSASYVTKATAAIPDCIILPGSKNTIADLRWLRQRGLDRWIVDCHQQGACVWGICGGFQMLGKTVADPQGVEGAATSTEGLGILPVETTLLGEKTTRVVEARSAKTGFPFQAYEIHMGETRPAAGDSPFALINGVPEGFRAGGVIGTYLHGGLEDAGLLAELLAEVACYRGKSIPELQTANLSPRRTNDENYDLLADWFEQHADLARFEALYL